MSEPLIKGHQIMPPMGGWRIELSIKGQNFVFTGSPQNIVQEIASVQIKNGVYSSHEDIWGYCNGVWCERDPDRCIKSDFTASTKTMSSKLLTFAYALKSLVMNGLKPVNQNDADRRALICSQCPANKSVESCSSCLATVKLISKSLIGTRNTRYDRKLKHCGVCGCDLKMKVHFPLNQDDKNDYPSNCWVDQESKKQDE